MIKFISFILLISSVLSLKLPCNHKIAAKKFDKPIYNFSIQLLDNVAQDTYYHFVFSPLSTWLQLTSLAEGTRTRSEREIRKVTGYQRNNKCLIEKYLQVLNGIDREMGVISKRRNIIVFNNLLDIQKSFLNEARKWYSTKTFILDFNDPEYSSDIINDVVNNDTDGIIEEAIQAEDFYFRTLLMTEATYLKSDWRSPFNAAYTSENPFYSEENIKIGNVNMMTQIGYFKASELLSINAKVLELPFQTERISMLVLLPTKGTVLDMFYNLKDINLTTVLNSFGKDVLINVTLPRFKIRTEVENLPELLYDMGVKSIFLHNSANFRGISKYKMHNLMMKQIADIEITEKSATARVVAESLIGGKTEEFVANKPFAYLIVDKKINVILFAGIYKNPTVY